MNKRIFLLLKIKIGKNQYKIISQERSIVFSVLIDYYAVN